MVALLGRKGGVWELDSRVLDGVASRLDRRNYRGLNESICKLIYCGGATSLIH